MADPAARVRFFPFYLSLSLLLLIALLARLAAPFQGGLAMEPHVERLVGGVLASPGFWADAAHFALGLLAVHLAFAAALWLASAGWLAVLHAPRRTLRLVQVLLLALALLAVFILNTRWYPLVPSSFLRRAPALADGPLLIAIAGLFAVSLVVSLWCWALRRGALLAPAAVGLGLAAIAALGLWTPPATGGGIGSRDPARPNLLLIGVDSLRPDETGFVSGSKLTPNIDAFLREARWFDTAYTPLGRTFGGWMAALTGREPITSGARENLIGNDQVSRDATLGHWLRALGYRTVLAMDERHFSAVDEGFGFDAVVGPEHGVLDLLISYFDHPLVNLISHRPLAKHLFPYLYLNRGRAYHYEPKAYTDAALAELAEGGQQPLFLALHFLLPHYPYVSNSVEELDDMEFDPRGDKRYHYFYRMLLRQADHQFGDLMAGLEEQGLLDNTLVVLLSDHGDSFQLERDAAQPGTDAKIEVETNTRGHGTNVLAQGQYRVMLALRGYGLQGNRTGRVAALPPRNGQTVSLIDIAPTVADLLAGTGALPQPWPGMDGHSLLGPIPPERGIYLESALTSMALMQSEIDEQQLLSETARYYMVNDAGKVVMRPDLIEATIATKLRAVVRDHWLLSMSPSLPDDLILLDTREKVWWPATAAPKEAPWRDMLADMCRHYDGDPGFDHYKLCGRLLAAAPVAGNP